MWIELAVSTSEAAPSFLRPLIRCRNSQVRYAYPHDFNGSSFPIKKDNVKYPKSNGWPEWFSRGWTLQEMIAPRDLQFFNKYWQPIGDKKTLAQTLQLITQVPKYILADGLEGNCPCVAQIISWAANRMTTQVEDGVLGLLDVNIPILYGEEEGISPSSAGDHPLIRRPKHLCLRIQLRCADWQYPRRCPEFLRGLFKDGANRPRQFIEKFPEGGRSQQGRYCSHIPKVV